jgi:hypothetical protein
MKWIKATMSFLFVSAGVFFISGWCLLAPPLEREDPETSRLERLRLLARLDWAHNRWGFALGPLCGAVSAGLTIQRARRKSTA